MTNSTSFKRVLLVVLLVAQVCCLWANASIKSSEDDYFDFLVLNGKADRDYLVYKTLSTNDYEDSWKLWNFSFSKTKDLPVDKGKLTVYDPYIYTSYNAFQPYGQNDGSLWQGKGFNIKATAGVTYRYKGLTVTFKPDIDFSQNAEYKTIGGTYGYFWGHLDLVQRYGDKAFFDFDLGDSQIRFDKGCFTVGIGTEYVWLGPTYLNAILMSNNAPTYPKFDLGIKPVDVKIPWTDINIGKVELHYSLGILKNTKYAICCPDTKSLLHVFTFALQPSFWDNLTIGAMATGHTVYSWEAFAKLFNFKNDIETTSEDLKMSLTFDFLFPEYGFEAYGEWGWDDYNSNYIRSLYHTSVFQLGIKKSFTLSEKKKLYGRLVVEIGNMEMTNDAFTEWTYNFQTHGYVSENCSYTNKGQLLGAGSAWAGNTQYVDFTVFGPFGEAAFYIQRSNPDNNYIFNKVINILEGRSSDYFHNYFTKYKGILDFGLSGTYIVNDKLTLSGKIGSEVIVNNHYTNTKNSNGSLTMDTVDANFHVSIGATYSI